MIRQSDEVLLGACGFIPKRGFVMRVIVLGRGHARTIPRSIWRTSGRLTKRLGRSNHGRSI